MRDAGLIDRKSEDGKIETEPGRRVKAIRNKTKKTLEGSGESGKRKSEKRKQPDKPNNPYKPNKTSSLN